MIKKVLAIITFFIFCFSAQAQELYRCKANKFVHLEASGTTTDVPIGDAFNFSLIWDWQNKEAQMRYTAEYMANEYKNESANMKYKYNELKKTVKKLIEAIPQDRILWQQDVKDLVQQVEEQMEKHDVRD